MEKKTGRIIQAIAGFYYCQTADEKVYECRARGLFRNEDITPLAGDMAVFETDGAGGYVTEIIDRKNAFKRPPLANLDQLLLITAVAAPAPNLLVLDKLITVCEYKEIEPILVVTKTDLEEDMFLLFSRSFFKISPVT